MNVDSLLLYFVTWFLIALTPGPAVICVISQAARYGLGAGFRGVVGIQIGNLIFFLGIAFGLVTLLMAVTNAFVVLQIAGAAYLFYLGVRLVISSLRRTSGEAIPARWPAERPGTFVVQAALVQLTNPKALMFVLSLVPQFLDSEQPLVFQIAILLSCTVAVDTLVLGSYVLLANRGTHALRHTAALRWIQCDGRFHWKQDVSSA
jgi:homoserine/homoserine lactone efflux protein